ncbi:XdhC family protein [Deinococcus cavernae]|uniref:XdhC family protein n=1 Tax=Deinococcus cavernae TaxID=2320857 RepID=UPI001F2A0803|nr:XdhC family protein [Deinococcus cavernae]
MTLAELPAGTNIVIMTHDHAEDAALCDAALRRPDLGFVGLIGSGAKWSHFREQLNCEGHTDAPWRASPRPSVCRASAAKRPPSSPSVWPRNCFRSSRLRPHPLPLPESDPIMTQTQTTQPQTNQPQTNQPHTNQTLYRATFMHTPASPFETPDALQVQEDGGLLVAGGVIQASGPFSELRAGHPGAEVSDLRGGLLLPGLSTRTCITRRAG